MKRTPTAQPLSARYYLLTSLVGLVFAAGFTVFYVYRVPKLVASGVQDQIFYLLLIPWALACSAFLFGALKSYARFTYNHLGSFLELGGPVILFCLVLIGGFHLVPPPPETFDLAVRAHSKDAPLINSGQITLDLPGLPHASIGSDGEANFKSIPVAFKSKPIRVLARVDGYEEKWSTPSLTDNILDVDLTKLSPIIVLTGSISAPLNELKTLKVLVDSQSEEASVDEFGRFNLHVSGKPGDRIRLKIFSNKRLVYDDFQTLPGPITLTIRKSR